LVHPSHWDRGFLKTCSASWVSSPHSFPWPADEKKTWNRKPWACHGGFIIDIIWKNDICLKKGYGGIYGDISLTGIKFIKVHQSSTKGLRQSQVMTDFKGPILVAKLCSRWWIDRKSGCGRRMNMYKSKKQMKHGIRYVGCARRWWKCGDVSALKDPSWSFGRSRVCAEMDGLGPNDMAIKPSLEHKEYGGKPWKFRDFPGMFKQIYRSSDIGWLCGCSSRYYVQL
jgi:hypothetical protein